MDQTKRHYSYRIYADPETARTFDSERFGDTIGQWIKVHQEQVVFSQLRQVKDWRVIDVGAGTGRLTIPLLEAGAYVTACDASEPMLQILREKTKSPKLQVAIVDAHQLQFPDQAFDCALSFRMLLHVIDWKKALSELCRVSKDWVIFDFLPRHGFLLLAPLSHAVRRLFARNVQAYRTFPISEVRNALHSNGFEVVSLDSGFFLPIAVHRLIGQTRFTKATENFFSSIRLSQMAGSPITIFARRKK